MKVDTLENYTVIYKHLNIQGPDTTLGKEVLYLMCKDAAVGIKLQCGREYVFLCEDARATELHKLTEGQLKGLPTNNLITERDLSKFSQLAEVAKYRNYQFKAKGIRNDMTLYKSNKGEVLSVARKLRKVLDSHEKEWNAKQKALQVARIEQKMSLSTKK